MAEEQSAQELIPISIGQDVVFSDANDQPVRLPAGEYLGLLRLEPPLVLYRGNSREVYSLQAKAVSPADGAEAAGAVLLGEDGSASISLRRVDGHGLEAVGAISTVAERGGTSRISMMQRPTAGIATKTVRTNDRLPVRQYATPVTQQALQQAVKPGLASNTVPDDTVRLRVPLDLRELNQAVDRVDVVCTIGSEPYTRDSFDPWELPGGSIDYFLGDARVEVPIDSASGTYQDIVIVDVPIREKRVLPHYYKCSIMVSFWFPDGTGQSSPPFEWGQDGPWEQTARPGTVFRSRVTGSLMQLP